MHGIWKVLRCLEAQGPRGRKGPEEADGVSPGPMGKGSVSLEPVL